MSPNERIKGLIITQQIRLYEQRCKTFGRAILEASQANDFELAKLLLCKKKKLEEAIRLLRQGGCVKYVPRPPVLNANFKKPLLSEAELTDPSSTKTELDSVKNLKDKRNILVRILQTQHTEVEELLKYLQCFSHGEIGKELVELTLSNKHILAEITEERRDLNELEPHIWNAYMPELSKNLSLGSDQLQVAVTWLKPDLSLSCTHAPNRFISIKLNYPVDEPQEKSLPEDFTSVKDLRADYTFLFYLFRNVSPSTISQMKLPMAIKQRSAKMSATLHETEISLMDLDLLANLCFEIDAKNYGFVEVLVRRRRPTNHNGTQIFADSNAGLLSSP
ncbi:hypothetical protein CRM22_003535 [Opisthorchis felineus]|uniref:Uncharacterized protein n=1 Tax=Opisthorchis felineus TaxID=147828 RepID=A0A4S2M0S2_OPIFE|nr:hypothetical protein CRM22_003535 [Opisthorchis felineus]